MPATQCYVDSRLVLLFLIIHSDEYLARLKEELNQVEAESAMISNEIQDLSRNHIEGEASLT